jgi:hypothetical protein
MLCTNSKLIQEGFSPNMSGLPRVLNRLVEHEYQQRRIASPNKRVNSELRDEVDSVLLVFLSFPSSKVFIYLNYFDWSKFGK